MKKTSFSLSLLAFAALQVTWNGLYAQDQLSLDEAISAALAANYGIRVARFDVQASENNVYRGNAGLLPTLGVQGGANYNNNNARVDIIAGTDPATGAPVTETREANGVETSSANLGLNLNWTIFNGFANTRRFEILAASAELSKEQLRNVVEQQVIQVANAYYQLARLSRTQRIQAQSLVRSQERLAFVQNQAGFGVANSLAVLNARVDVNTDSVNLATTMLSLDNARRNLNFLMGADLDADASVEEEVTLAELPSLQELENMVAANNVAIQTAEQSLQLNELNLRVSEAGRYPTLSVNSSYGINYANNGPFSFAPRILSYGFAGGVSLNVPIYNGSRLTKGIQQAEITVAQSNAQLTQVQQQVLRDLRNAYFTYQNNLQIYRLQQLSVEAARENYIRTEERFRLGQSTSIAFREAQLNLLLAENRLNDVLFDARLNELNLLQLTGSLIPAE